MSTKHLNPEQEEEDDYEEEDDDEEELERLWDDWQSDEDGTSFDYICLFCDLRYNSPEKLFEHCSFEHSFDFHGIVKDLRLDFYSSFKLINYIRSQIAVNKSWRLDLLFKNNEHFPWEEDSYLNPFMTDDALLYSFANEEDDDEDFDPTATKEEILIEPINDEDIAEINSEHCNLIKHPVTEETRADHFEKSENSSLNGGNCRLKANSANVVNREIKNVNENYFGSYSCFSIHKEMISDKVRTEAYRVSILSNPSLFNQAKVMDVGCGTGILSLFAAQAGSSKVTAVEASFKMATTAAQIAKENGFLYEEGEGDHSSGVIDVVQSMIEELDQFRKIPPHSFDVLVSEWMGYGLLYESMLTSVLYARDRWLKPGGAILPDTATILIAGFGRGGTSLPFWENVYGLDMSCIGKEAMEHAASSPIVDVMDSKHIVTESAVLQSFDLITMKPDELDFTSSCELILKKLCSEPIVCMCYGIVLWFETGFTSRFCKEMPTMLSTSPYSPATHWSQTILTFQEPIAMTCAESIKEYDAVYDPEMWCATRIISRISIARSSVHRSIDISMETTGISLDGRKRSWPAQIFAL